ncbi:MAG: AraC family transcriptional regulator [Pseudomonadota bacterium]
MPQIDSGLDGLALVFEDAGPHKYPVHTHDGYSVIGLKSGAKWFDTAGQQVRVDAPAIAVANPGTPHGCSPVDGPWSHRTWYISAELMADIAGTPDAVTPRFCGPVIQDEDLALRLRKIHEQDPAESPLDWQSDALGALQALAESHMQAERERPVLHDTASQHRMKAYEPLLLANLSGPAPDLKSLADKGGVHVNQVIRDFRQVYGLTPGEFLRMKRLEHAKQILGEGSSLTEAAMDAGFSDQSHFSRMFRKAYGMTPSAYRNLGSGNLQKNPL